MKIFKDILSGDEMLSDAFVLKEVEGVLYEVEGKTETEKTDVDDSLIGGNKSAEEQAEDLEDQGVTGVNIVLRHKLQEWQGYTKKDYQKHIKLYIGKIVEHLQKTDPDAVAAFKADAQKAVVKILGKFNDIQLFRGESYDPDPDKGECMLAVLEYRGETPYMLFFKDGLLGEKV